jgi:hypothetical protein
MSIPKGTEKGAGRGEKGVKRGMYWAAVAIMMAASFAAIFVINAEKDGYAGNPSAYYAFGVIAGAALVTYLGIVWRAANVP